MNNKPQTVIIPTAGLGTRMGNYTRDLNKALLPYRDHAVLAHIINNFPTGSKFIIALGHFAQQITDYCTVAFPETDIEFVTVTDYTSLKSGTALTLQQCMSKIHTDFWYIPCDTYFDQSLFSEFSPPPDADTVFVARVPESVSNLYTMFSISDNFTVAEIAFKQTKPESWSAFTGLMYIHNWQQFKADILNLNATEFIYAIKPGMHTETLDTWRDFGSPAVYQLEISLSQLFDFSKRDEITYVHTNRVIKWWRDNTVAQKKYQKIQANLSVYPDNCVYSGNFLAYDLFPGKTLYQHNDVNSFPALLQWLDSSVWRTVDRNIESASSDFYKTKSLSRIQQFLSKNPALTPVTRIDGVLVKPALHYLEQIDWNYLSSVTESTEMHGDLQFDNVIISESAEFRLIDWRPEFAGIVESGDLYYDLAKMSGGFIIDYSRIKQHNFNIEIVADEVTLSIPSIDNCQQYQQQLRNYAVQRGLDYDKIRLLVPIIFWNMAPLHTAPFDQFLWYLGIRLFAELDNE